MLPGRRPERSTAAPVRGAINGLGRIGRAVLKIALETPQLEVAAVNDLADAATLAYLLNFDTVRGRYRERVEAGDGSLVVGGRRLEALRRADPATLPWRRLDVELVFDCTGAFFRRNELERHLRAGARAVLLSAPSPDPNVPTLVYGVNAVPVAEPILSCGSCTTNCVAPLVEIIGRRIGILKAAMTNVQAYTASQTLVDRPSARLRRGRAAGANLVPTSTEAPLATARALSRYAGRFGGARYAGVLGVMRDPLVSSDVLGDSRASVVDLELTQVIGGDLVKIMSWYDNEWGHASQMVRTAIAKIEATKSGSTSFPTCI